MVTEYIQEQIGYQRIELRKPKLKESLYQNLLPKVNSRC